VCYQSGISKLGPVLTCPTCQFKSHPILIVSTRTAGGGMVSAVVGDAGSDLVMRARETWIMISFSPPPAP
jgi:hypothetical protein